MKFSTQQIKNVGAVDRRFVMVLALVSLISGLSVSPAFADRNNGREGPQGGHHDQRMSRDHRGGHEHWRRDGYGRGGYEQPVYVPPPVYYAPQQSPGISLFFPLDFRR